MGSFFITNPTGVRQHPQSGAMTKTPLRILSSFSRTEISPLIQLWVCFQKELECKYVFICCSHTPKETSLNLSVTFWLNVRIVSIVYNQQIYMHAIRSICVGGKYMKYILYQVIWNKNFALHKIFDTIFDIHILVILFNEQLLLSFLKS